MGLVPATYVQATPDLMMGDLLKNMRSSQIFSVCGLPEVAVHKVEAGRRRAARRAIEVELLGLDMFDPTTMEADHRRGDDVPCWLLDTDYNGLCFHVSQAFFPRTAAWDDLKKALKARLRRDRVGSPGRHAQRAVRGGRAQADCGEGDRRPRQRAAGREGAGVTWISMS